MKMLRWAGIAAAALAALFVVAWLAAPLGLRLTLDRGMRDLRRNEGLVGKFGSVERAGLGFELEGLEIRTPEGELVGSANAIRATPAMRWPPVSLSVAGARLTQRGLDAWAKGFAGASSSWYAKTAQAVRRDYPALAGHRVAVKLDGLSIERSVGTIVTSGGVLAVTIPSTTRVEATFDGGLALDPNGPAPCGPPTHTFAATSASLEIFQDSLSLRLTGDFASLNPTCRDCLYGHMEAARTAPAPGWAAVVTTSASWSGPAELGCVLGWTDPPPP
ncbi:MAG TPA: hypothetical protein VMV18_07350, partial [bacterium]|nr:hypothetical protein [bacterium]